jgi:hypothetical protein
MLKTFRNYTINIEKLICGVSISLIMMPEQNKERICTNWFLIIIVTAYSNVRRHNLLNKSVQTSNMLSYPWLTLNTWHWKLNWLLLGRLLLVTEYSLIIIFIHPVRVFWNLTHISYAVSFRKINSTSYWNVIVIVGTVFEKIANLFIIPFKGTSFLPSGTDRFTGHWPIYIYKKLTASSFGTSNLRK